MKTVIAIRMFQWRGMPVQLVFRCLFVLPLDVVSDGQSTATDVGDASHDEAMSDDRETCKFSTCLI